MRLWDSSSKESEGKGTDLFLSLWEVFCSVSCCLFDSIAEVQFEPRHVVARQNI